MYAFRDKPYSKAAKTMNKPEEILKETSSEDVEVEILPEVDEEKQMLKDQLIRALAEVDNTRKRLEKEKDDKVKFAITALAKDLLPVIDSFVEIGKYDYGDEANEAISNIRDLFRKALETHGVSSVEHPVGKPVNPDFHEVITMETKPNVPRGTVTQVLRHGYVLNGRLLRPTMVVVAGD